MESNHQSDRQLRPATDFVVLPRVINLQPAFLARRVRRSGPAFAACVFLLGCVTCILVAGEDPFATDSPAAPTQGENSRVTDRGGAPTQGDAPRETDCGFAPTNRPNTLPLTKQEHLAGCHKEKSNA